MCKRSHASLYFVKRSNFILRAYGDCWFRNLVDILTVYRKVVHCICAFQRWPRKVQMSYMEGDFSNRTIKLYPNIHISFQIQTRSHMISSRPYLLLVSLLIVFLMMMFNIDSSGCRNPPFFPHIGSCFSFFCNKRVESHDRLGLFEH